MVKKKLVVETNNFSILILHVEGNCVFGVGKGVPLLYFISEGWDVFLR